MLHHVSGKLYIDSRPYKIKVKECTVHDLTVSALTERGNKEDMCAQDSGLSADSVEEGVWKTSHVRWRDNDSISSVFTARNVNQDVSVWRQVSAER